MAHLELNSISRRGRVIGQNTSHAVMAQRAGARDSLDDFPTPPRREDSGARATKCSAMPQTTIHVNCKPKGKQ